MNKNFALVIASLVFFIVAGVHFIRLVKGWGIVVAGTQISMTVSGIGLIVALLLSIWMFLASRS
jgi:hypothetical protein